MPYLKIQSNQEIAENKKEDIVLKASKLLSTELGKPESYIQVVFEPAARMCFAGTCAPTVFMELKSIGLSNNMTGALAKALCGFAEEILSVDKSRVYIEFLNIDGSMWGWNNRTF